MSGEPREFVSYDRAVAMLPDKERVHTFRGGMGMMLGCDVDKPDLLKIMKANEQTLELSGDMAASMGHGLVVFHDGYLFIEADPAINSNENTAVQQYDNTNGVG
jgi:hypothetical protein